MDRREAVEQLEAMERVLVEQLAQEVAAAAAFDQASAHHAEAHTRVIVARQQLRAARCAVLVAFELPGAGLFEAVSAVMPNG